MICISQLKRFARMMTSYVMTLYEVNRDPRTPLLPRIIIIIALGYALSPIDFIPDFIPVIGYFDDLIVIPLLIYIARRLIPLEIWNECSIKASNRKEHLPKNKLAGLIIIIIWMVLIGLLVMYMINKII